MTGEVDENRAPRPSSRWAGAAALGVLLLVAVASSLALLPVAPHSATAPADEFTAERAMAHVTQLARAPRPVGGFRAPQQRVVAYPEVTVTSRVTV